MSALRYAVVFGVSLVLIAVCSCKKSDKDEMLTTANNAAKAIDVGLTNWAMTNGLNWQTNGKILVTAEKLAEAAKMSITNDVYVEIGAAGAFLKHLLNQGLLPGISKDEHGDATSDTLDLVISNKAVEITYPVKRTWHFVKDGETSTNNYTLVKQSKDDEWKLQKAWLTDSNGQMVQEWPVQ
jgi:hypothetical protein